MRQYTFQIDTFRPFNRKAKCSVPNELSKWSQPAAHTKSGGIVKSLRETVMVEEHTGSRVDIRKGILCLEYSQLS